MKSFDRTTSDPIEAHLDEAFSLIVEEPPRRRSLRCSALPYCPVLDTLIPDEPNQLDLNGALFTSMGTAAHSAIQLYMSLADKYGASVWGSWKCIKCTRELKYQFRPAECCGLPMRYEEVDFRVGPMTGHMDLIARYGDKWVAYEFKTIGAKPEKPKRVHRLQIRHYVALMKRVFDIDVYGYTVVYIGRQFLERWKFGPYNARGSIKQTTDWMFRAIDGFKAATQARKDPSRDNLIAVVKARPCTSLDTWDEYMSRSHSFEKGKCPMLTRCIKGNSECLRAMESTIHGE